jgi:hypothetical protein
MCNPHTSQRHACMFASGGARFVDGRKVRCFLDRPSSPGPPPSLACPPTGQQLALWKIAHAPPGAGAEGRGHQSPRRRPGPDSFRPQGWGAGHCVRLLHELASPPHREPHVWVQGKGSSGEFYLPAPLIACCWMHCNLLTMGPPLLSVGPADAEHQAKEERRPRRGWLEQQNDDDDGRWDSIGGQGGRRLRLKARLEGPRPPRPRQVLDIRQRWQRPRNRDAVDGVHI